MKPKVDQVCVKLCRAARSAGELRADSQWQLGRGYQLAKVQISGELLGDLGSQIDLRLNIRLVGRFLLYGR